MLRLKDKLGNRSNASSEIELHDADGWLLGDEGRGVSIIIEMATYTRLDCVIATAGMQRRALAVALHHAAAREAFGAPLIEQPLMRAVLADLAVESEAATRLAMYLASCYEPDAPEGDRLLGRLLTSAAKFHVCKRGPQFAAEALEVLGGNGYVEEQDLARIYRELPLLSIWEGSGNVMCLDVLRGLSREPDSVQAVLARLDRAAGTSDAYDDLVARLRGRLTQPDEADARLVSHELTVAVQGALLLEHAPAPVAQAFRQTRLAAGGWGASFGTLPRGLDVTGILRHAAPVA
ncbi:MAG: acyl-CoA dehydrogenase family protein [Woeseiaceae bacterium]|nr:acyl-CoA dehydrogenase family protein [Woeseiaceae bacterium]